MKFSISPEVNPECDEKLKDSRISRDDYTMATEGFTMAPEPYTGSKGRTHEFYESGKGGNTTPWRPRVDIV